MGVYTSKYMKSNYENVFEKKDFNILFIGRLVEKKGLEYALKAVKLIEGFDIKLHICGKGPRKKNIESISKKR